MEILKSNEKLFFWGLSRPKMPEISKIIEEQVNEKFHEEFLYKIWKDTINYFRVNDVQNVQVESYNMRIRFLEKCLQNSIKKGKQIEKQLQGIEENIGILLQNTIKNKKNFIGFEFQNLIKSIENKINLLKNSLQFLRQKLDELMTSLMTYI